MKQKDCAFCERKIPANKIVCSDHIEDFKLYRDEEWFQDLVRSSNHMADLEGKEASPILEDTYQHSIEHKGIPYKYTQIYAEYVHNGVSNAKLAKKYKYSPAHIGRIIRTMKAMNR